MDELKLQPGPCVVCGATNYRPSFGGPNVCPPCDCGTPPEVTRLRGELVTKDALIAELRKELKDRCDSCGAKTQDDCKLCGAPQCCPRCCFINYLEAALSSEREKARKLVEDVATFRILSRIQAMLRREGFVFDGTGGRWEKLAFTLYTDICQIDRDAEEALKPYATETGEGKIPG